MVVIFETFHVLKQKNFGWSFFRFFCFDNIGDIEEQCSASIFKSATKSGNGKWLTRKTGATYVKIRNFLRVSFSYIAIEILIIIFEKLWSNFLIVGFIG